MMKYFVFACFLFSIPLTIFNSVQNSMHFQSLYFSPQCKKTQHRHSVTDKDVVQYHILKIAFVFIFINKMS